MVGARRGTRSSGGGVTALQIGDLMFCTFATPGPCILVERVPVYGDGFWHIFWHGGISIMHEQHLVRINEI